MSAALKKLQEEMQQVIKDSCDKLAAGDAVDLAGLDTKVQEFCQMIGTLSADDARNWQQPLSELQKQMNELGELLTAQREALLGAIGNVETQKQAHRAYKASSGTLLPDNDTKEEG